MTPCFTLTSPPSPQPHCVAPLQFYLAEIILGVEALHAAGILHRDLKPENVLMQSNGHLVITDFGCSIQSKQAGVAPTSRAFVGTDMYMAPEQVMKQEYSEAVDWYRTI